MRNELRFVSNARVYVVDDDKNETPATLSDLSKSGLAIESEAFLDIEPSSKYVIVIVPEEETNIDKFQLEIESRWVKLSKSSMKSGFSVLLPFDEDEFQEYLEFLAQKHNAENPQKPSGEGQNDPPDGSDSSP